VQAGAFPIGIDVRSSTSSRRAPTRSTCTSACGASTRAASCWWASTGSTTPRACRSAARLPRVAGQVPGELRNSATLIQIASPSREDVSAYTDILHELESLCGSINGNFGELDWMPVRYIHRTVARARCRACTARAAWRWSRRCATA
jgi:trehalose 6-phosphate synthase